MVIEKAVQQVLNPRLRTRVNLVFERIEQTAMNKSRVCDSVASNVHILLSDAWTMCARTLALTRFVAFVARLRCCEAKTLRPSLGKSETTAAKQCHDASFQLKIGFRCNKMNSFFYK